MIKHIVMWKLKESANGLDRAGNARAIKEKLEGLRGRIPGLLELEVGIDFSAGEGSCDVVLCAALASRQALKDYQAHPEHQAILPFVREAAAERRLVDYEV